MERTINIMGIAKMSVAADWVLLTIQLSAKNSDYEVALNELSEKVSCTILALVNAKIRKTDIKTLAYNVRTNYKDSRSPDGQYSRVFDGYIFEQRLTVGFAFSSKKLANVIGAISNVSSNPNLNITFTIKDDEKIKDMLLESAVENATKKANVLCASMGVELGDIININYNFDKLKVKSPTEYLRGDAALMRTNAAFSPEFSPADIELFETVEFTWAII